MTRLPLVLMLMFAAVPSTRALASEPADNEPKTARAWLERYQEARQGPEQTERFTQSYKVGADGALDLQNIAGDVRVTAGRGNEIQIEAIKRVRHRNPTEAKRFLSELGIDVSHVGNRVEVRTLFPRNGRGFSGSVDYTISVPSGAAVALKTISGDIAVNGVRGEVRAETISGDVLVQSTPNLALAKAVSGDVTARDASSATALTLGTVSGNLSGTGLKARTLDAGTVSGNVHLSNVQLERLQAKSVSGDIEFDASLARGGRYEFNSHSGNVRVILADAPGFELDASTFSGSIRSDFPVTLRSTSSERSGRRGGLNRAIRGSYGDASASIAVRSFSGTVVVTRK